MASSAGPDADPWRGPWSIDHSSSNAVSFRIISRSFGLPLGFPVQMYWLVRRGQARMCFLAPALSKCSSDLLQWGHLSGTMRKECPYRF